ncbi:MAG: SRPBCC family protein [Pseudomonadota bacterium]
MSFFALILVGILALAVLIAGVGMMMPRVVHVSRSMIIAGPIDTIYDEIVNLQRFTTWSPWADKDPDMAQDFNNIVGVGAVMTWSGNKAVGSGKMEITETQKPNSAKLALDFGGMGTATAYWTLEDTGDAVLATWAVDADMGAGPIGRLMGPMMDKWIGADYEQGLLNLKAKIETA